MPDWINAKKYVLARLAEELPEGLYYHGIHHTRDDVLPAVEHLAKLASLGYGETLLLQTAALYHDIGFIEAYQDNEPIAARIAAQTLPQFGYTPEQIQVVGQIVLATHLPQSPQSYLEQLMCDADLDSLGRDDYLVTSHNLWKELKHHGAYLTSRQWYQRQIDFLGQHTYFTSVAQALRGPGKRKNLEMLKARLAHLSDQE
ncbi:MAG: HD domain-containing protein [Chloroflexota bacterium]